MWSMRDLLFEASAVHSKLLQTHSHTIKADMINFPVQAWVKTWRAENEVYPVCSSFKDSLFVASYWPACAPLQQARLSESDTLPDNTRHYFHNEAQCGGAMCWVCKQKNIKLLLINYPGIIIIIIIIIHL